MCRKFTFLIVMFLLLCMLVAGAKADTWNVPNGEIAVSGVVDGNYHDVNVGDNHYESITEVSNGSYSYLEHKWTINVTGSDAVILSVGAYQSSSSDGDNFVFAYSTDNVNYTDMFTVTKTADDNATQDYVLPRTTSGTIYIRVKDTDRTAGHTALDVIHVDNIFVSNIAAGSSYFNGISGSWTGLWSDANCWSDGVPMNPDLANLSSRRKTCIVDSNIAAVCGKLAIGEWLSAAGAAQLNMTGGTITIVNNNAYPGNIVIGSKRSWLNVPDTGILTISGGSITATGDVNVGGDGVGTINMSGGSITANGKLRVPADTGSGTINLTGGYISAGSFSMGSNGLIDIYYPGYLVINGDVTTTVNGYVSSNKIVAASGNGNVIVQYNTWFAGKTVVFAQCGKSSQPIPANGMQTVDSLPILSWTKGTWDANHNVYFGTSYSDVDNATTATAGIYKGNQTTATYSPGQLSLGNTYYWRIDEINNSEGWGSPWKGNVWSFKVNDYNVVDNFESYTSDSDIALTWIDTDDPNNSTNAYVFLGTDICHTDMAHAGGVKSLEYDYDSDNSPYYSETWRNYTTDQNWTKGQVKKLTLFFHGVENNIKEQMYVILKDSKNSTGKISYAGDTNDMVQYSGEWWHVWNINIQDFNTLGVDLSKIRKITIGSGTNGTRHAGVIGTVCLDDVRLYQFNGQLDYEDSLLRADIDVNKVVNLRDYAKFANAWQAKVGEAGYDANCDLRSNETVDNADLRYFTKQWLWGGKKVTVTINAGVVDHNISAYLGGVNGAFAYDTDNLYADGTRANYLEDANVKVFRYPGGGESSYFHWQYPYMPIYKDVWSGSYDPNQYVTSGANQMDPNEAVTLCKSIGAEPLFVVNFQSGLKYKTVQDSVNEARDWVQYSVNHNWGVKYWVIENEPYYGNNYPNAVTVQAYADYVHQFATAMRAVDPNIKIFANWNNELTDPNYWAKWEYLLEHSGNDINYADVHWYWDWSYGTWGQWLEENPMRVREWCGDCNGPLNRYAGPSYADEIKSFHNKIKDVNGHDFTGIKLTALEWNVAPVQDARYSKFQHALMQAEMMGQFMEGGLEMATIWPLAWNMYTNWDFDTLFDVEYFYPDPTMEVFNLYKTAFGQKYVSGSCDEAHVRTFTVLSQNGNTLWVYLVHKTGKAVTASMNISNFTPVSAEAITFAAPNVSSAVGKLQKMTIGVNPATGKWESVLPPYSLTRLTFHK